MNSIDDDALAAPLACLFDELLLPMAERMRASGALAFPLAPDVRWLSYYVRRKRSSMTPADFMGASCADAGEFELRLAAHWQALGRHELVAQVARFGSAARAAQALQSSAPAEAELSPYVYAMF